MVLRRPRVDERGVQGNNEHEPFTSTILGKNAAGLSATTISLLKRDWEKELLAVRDGFRESEQSWKELLLELKGRGLEIDPKLAIADGGLGFWRALPQVYPSTRTQRCWVHKK